MAAVTVLSVSVSPSPGILRCLSFPSHPYIRVLRQRRSGPSGNHSRENHRSAASWLPTHGVAGEQVPPEPSSACEPCTGCAAIRFFVVRFRNCSSDVFFLVIGRGTRLLPGDCSRSCLLPGDRSWDCTANTFLHRLWSMTSSIALCRLVRMEPPMPSAWDPSLGTL